MEPQTGAGRYYVHPSADWTLQQTAEKLWVKTMPTAICYTIGIASSQGYLDESIKALGLSVLKIATTITQGKCDLRKG
jgi:hypothetical protein